MNGNSVSVAAAILILILIVIVIVFSRRREGFFFVDTPYISVTHVKPEVVPLMLDAARGPTSIPPLSSQNGLWIYEGDSRSTGLCVGDAALVAYESDQSMPLPRLVAPLPYQTSQRAFFLLSPVDSRQRIPTLRELIAQPLRVFCPTGVEASLFAIAWAIAGGGDVPPERVEVTNGWESAARAALSARQNGEFAIVPVWACQGSLAQTTVISSWPKGTAASISYHPKDLENDDGFLLESAPHMIKARSPVLTASPVPIVAGTRPSDSGLLTQNVLVAPSLVLLYDSDKDIDSMMADKVSDALLKDHPEMLAMCTFYQALGIPLLPRTEETVRAFERKRMNRHASVLEEFEQPPIELVPTHAVSLAMEWKEGGSYAEATLLPQGTVSIDGVRLRAGDRVILENQEDFGEAGRWIVVSLKGPRGIPVFQQPVALDPKDYVTKLERVKGQWQWRFSFLSASSVLKDGDRVAWLPLPGAPTGTVDAIGRIVIPADKVVASPEAAKFEKEWFDPLARCLDHDAIGHSMDTRQQCKSTKGHVWDRPCTSDVECPFLQEGTETGRGRCLKSGRCEVPVGVRSTAYRSLASTDENETMVCRCDGEGEGPISLSLNAASHECCDRPDAIPVFTMTDHPFV